MSRAAKPISGTATPSTFRGYAAVARFMNAFDGITMFRRFRELHVRNLLDMQCELSHLEARIRNQDLASGDEQAHGSLRHDRDPVRKGLMKRVRSAAERIR